MYLPSKFEKNEN